MKNRTVMSTQQICSIQTITVSQKVSVASLLSKEKNSQKILPPGPVQATLQRESPACWQLSDCGCRKSYIPIPEDKVDTQVRDDGWKLIIWFHTPSKEGSPTIPIGALTSLIHDQPGYARILLPARASPELQLTTRRWEGSVNLAVLRILGILRNYNLFLMG